MSLTPNAFSTEIAATARGFGGRDGAPLALLMLSRIVEQTRQAVAALEGDGLSRYADAIAVDVDLDDFSDRQLLAECRARGLSLPARDPRPMLDRDVELAIEVRWRCRRREYGEAWRALERLFGADLVHLPAHLEPAGC